ncbi:hypothetical protein BJX64DRAFT_295137 [Aspergillus heterothallicus]
MLVKNILLSLGLLATAGLASPTPEVASDISIDTPPTEANTTTTPDLEKRSTGVWLDLYGSGSCSDSWRSQSGWTWAGQCKNFDGWTYGARAGKVDRNPNAWWDDKCTFKFWENADCHGHATVHHLSDSTKWKSGAWGAPYPEYQCFATADKADGSFYLTKGAQSVLMTC